MSFAELSQSIARDSVPPEMTAPLKGLWHASRGDWDAAHACAQGDPSPKGSWVHAYLHREEGDLGNASYWYSRARRTQPTADVSPQDEWTQIARALLGE